MANSNDSPANGYDVTAETLSRLVAADVTSQIEQRMRERERRRATRLQIVLSLVATVGLGGILTVSNVLIDAEVTSQLEARTEDYRERLSFQAHYQEFLTLLLSLTDEENESLRRDVLTELLRLLRELQSSPAFLEGHLTFPLHLDQLLQALVMANVEWGIDELDEHFRDRLVASPGTLQLLTRHYGWRVLTSNEPVSQQPEADIMKLLFYSQEAKKREFPEQHLFWMALLDLQSNDNQPTRLTRRLLSAVDTLEPEDHELFLSMVLLYSEPADYMKVPTEGANRLAESVEALIRELSNESRRALGTARMASLEAALEEFGQNPLSEQHAAQPERDALHYLALALEGQATEWDQQFQIKGRLGPGEVHVRTLDAAFSSDTAYRLLGACDSECLGFDVKLLGDAAADYDQDAPRDAPSASFRLMAEGVVRLTRFRGHFIL